MIAGRDILKSHDTRRQYRRKSRSPGSDSAPFADGVAVAFSGGIDSTVVAKAAVMALGDKAVAVTADSPSVPRNEIAEAKRIACEIGIRHVIVATAEFDNPDYQRNDGSRCYHCKSELYDQIIARLPSLGVDVVCSGVTWTISAIIGPD